MIRATVVGAAMIGSTFSIALLVSVGLIGTVDAAKPYVPVRPDPVLESWRWRTFPETQGLVIYSMIATPDGSIWIGTKEDIRRYDGVRWTTYTVDDGIIEPPILALCLGNDGLVYSGSPEGAGVFRGGVWARLFPVREGGRVAVYDIKRGQDGSLLFATIVGLCVATDGRVRYYTSSSTGEVLAQMAPEVEVIPVPDAMIQSIPWPPGIGLMAAPAGEHFLVFTLAENGPARETGIRIGDRVVLADGEKVSGNAWMFGLNDTVSLTLLRGTDTISVSVEKRVVDDRREFFPIDSVHQDRTGRYWMSNGQAHPIVFDPSVDGEEAWKRLDDVEGLPPGQALFGETPDGNVWIFTINRTVGYFRFDGRSWTSGRLSDVGGVDLTHSVTSTRDGALWVGGHEGSVHAFRDGAWTVYQPPDAPIPTTRIVGLSEASDGSLWIASKSGDVLRLDTRRPGQWETFDGLIFEFEGLDGSSWFLSQEGQAVRHGEEGEWIAYDTSDGLMDAPLSLFETRDGVVWATGSHDGIAATARFERDESVGSSIWKKKTFPLLSWAIDRAYFEDREGALWFAAQVDHDRKKGQRGGVLIYSPETDSWVHSDHNVNYGYGFGQTHDGAIWLGGVFGLLRYAGNSWIRNEDQAGPIDVIHVAGSGDLWLGNRIYGAMQLPGEEIQGSSSTGWIRHDARAGLVHNEVHSILEATDGTVWVGTTKGVSRYDGTAWTTHAVDPKIGSSRRGTIRESRDGSIWFNDFGKIWRRRSFPRSARGFEEEQIRTVRYSPDRLSPDTEIVIAAGEVSQPGNTAIAWRGFDPWNGTVQEDLQFSYRMDDGEWSSFSKKTSEILLALSSGSYAFEVKARDLDFNEDPTPAVASFIVVAPVWRRPWFVSLMVLLVGIAGVQTARVVRRDRRLGEAQDRLIEEMERELQTAHDMQMGLLPKESPQIPGATLSGICAPANHVGGDYFNYFYVDEARTRVGIVLADVAGKAMQAAPIAMRFNEVLRYESRGRTEPAEILKGIDASLRGQIPPTMFVTCGIAILDSTTRDLTFASAAHPEFYLVRDGQVDVRTVPGFPLGLALPPGTDVDYGSCVDRLRDKDVVVFVSDGVPDARNTFGDFYGTESLVGVLASIGNDASAESIRNQIVTSVQGFVGEADQVDDVTIVVLKIR